jgi:hypothetical protein
LGIIIKRADDRFAPEPFMEKVWTDICAARLVLADCTNRNPNVFYEIGLAHAIGKKVVLLTRSRADIPSDLLSREFLEYGDEPDKVVFLLRRLKEIFERYLGVPETAAKDAVDKIFDELKRAGAV